MIVRQRGTLRYQGDVRGRQLLYSGHTFVVGARLGCAADGHPYVVTEIDYDEGTNTSVVSIERALAADVLRWDRDVAVAARAGR